MVSHSCDSLICCLADKKNQPAELFANQKQRQKATQQITNAMNKRLNKDDERQF